MSDFFIEFFFLCSSYPVTSGFYFYFWEKASDKFEVFPEKPFPGCQGQRGYFLTVLGNAVITHVL